MRLRFRCWPRPYPATLSRGGNATRSSGWAERNSERERRAGRYLVYRRHHEKQWENSLLLVVITPYFPSPICLPDPAIYHERFRADRSVSP
ncbi:hypothetical protein DTO045G8_2787 [Paecilomyces variotii]|nr:hypothetical protein DTO045G8_2787 [Paecilomyces variotii]